jgi:hypothetical protein
MFKIIKKGSNNFWHVFNDGAKNVSISDFEVVLDDVLNTFVIVLRNGANIPQISLSVLDIIVIDETASSVEETFLTAEQLRTRLVVLGYTAYLGAGNADSITGLISEGTNVTITGTGTLADPYVISSSGGSGTTPTLQEVTTEGNETTDEVIFRASADLFVKIDSTTGFIEFWDLSIDAVNAISIINQSYINISDGATSKFEYNPYTNRLSIEDNLFEYVINSNGNVEILDKTTNKTLTIQIPTSITDTRAQTYQDASGTIALTSDIPTTATDLDALKRDGSNANIDVDLGDFAIKAKEVVTQTNGSTKKMILKSNNVDTEHTAEWQNKDYDGIADITDITDALATFKTDEFLDATSSIQGQLDSKQQKMSWISSSSPYTGTGSTALQKLSNAGSSGNGSFPAKANTRYKIEIQFQLSGLSTGTTNYVQFGILGTAGITSVNGQSLACKSATLISSNTPSYTALNSATISAALMTSGTQAFARATINIEVVTSTAGTLIIAFATNVSTTPIVENHIIRFIELGASSTTSSSDIV